MVNPEQQNRTADLERDSRQLIGAGVLASYPGGSRGYGYTYMWDDAGLTGWSIRVVWAP